MVPISKNMVTTQCLCMRHSLHQCYFRLFFKYCNYCFIMVT